MGGEIEYNTDNYKYIKDGFFNWADYGGYKDIGTNISGTKYDAARACWGGNWRMPTYQEVQELIKYCKVEEMDVGYGEDYFIVGPNGAYISIDIGGLCEYFWTSSIDGQGNSSTAWRFMISYGEIILETGMRWSGLRILPVCE